MKNFKYWKKEQSIDNFVEKSLNQEEFIRICLEYFTSNLKGNMKTYYEHKTDNLTESVETSRYSIEVNYRTTIAEVLEGYARLVLGFVSASLKKYNFHTKHVFNEKPLRLLISSRNWDNGEICGLITWNPEHNCFIVSKGFYNKDRKTVSIQNSKKCDKESAAELTRDMHNMMHKLKDEPSVDSGKLHPVKLRPGPKG